MNDILIALSAAGIFFGAMGIRGLYGYLRNNKVEGVSFDWRFFLKGSIKPVATILGVGALATLIILFLRLVAFSGLEVAGIDQISVQTLIIGLFIADIGAIGLAVKEVLLAFGLTEKQIEQIRQTASTTKEGERLGLEVQYRDGELVVFATNVQQDAGDSEEAKLTKKDLAQMGAFPYYKVDVSTPDKFFNAVNGRGFNEGYGMQCVAGFKEFQYSQAGRIVATSTGGASGYANQKAQIEALGFTHYTDGNLQNGDWVIFGGGQYGHVAMFYNGKYFGQNQGAANANVGNPFNLSSVGLPYLCHYRPNQYKKATPTPEPQPKPTPQPTGPQIGDRVTTSATKDAQNGLALNLAIINDGQSVWTEVNSKGNAVLRKGNVVRAAVPVNSLSKV